MSEEEKEAINEVKSYVEWVKDRGTNTDKNMEIVLNLIDKLQEENKNADERNYSLGLGFIQIGEKLGLENFGIQTILLGIDKLQKENQELKEDNSHQWKERCRLTFELERLKKENEKLYGEMTGIDLLIGE